MVVSQIFLCAAFGFNQTNNHECSTKHLVFIAVPAIKALAFVWSWENAASANYISAEHVKKR